MADHIYDLIIIGAGPADIRRCVRRRWGWMQS